MQMNACFKNLTLSIKMLRIISLFTILASAYVFAAGDSNTSQSSAFLDGSILFIASNDSVKLTLFLENGSGNSIFENPDDNEYVVESVNTYTIEEGPDPTYKITLSDGDFFTFDPSSGTGSLTDFSNGQIDESGSWDFSFERFDWEKYDDFSESSLDLTKWEVGYFAGGQEVTIENGQAKLSGSANSPNSAIQMPSDLAAAGDGATEGNTFLFFKDQEIHGIQADIYLPAENNSYEAGVYLTSIDTNPLGSLGAELRNESTGATFLFDCFDDYGKESEYQTNGSLGTFHQVRITKIDGKTSYFLDDNLIKQFASSSYNEDYWAIGAFNDNGAAYSSYADNVRVLRRSGKSSSVSSGYAPDSISGFSVISTGSDGTQYDPSVFSDHGIASRDYADRDYQYEKISSTQGKIIYPFSGGDDDMPEVTIVTFSSLNEGTYLWTEYSDSSLQNPVDTDQGSWKMIPGYERTADSQNPDLAPDSLAGLLAEYTSTNDSSSEIVYFSNNGTATAHSDGRMYGYEKISDNQGIITYSFENEAVPKPEITNITFTSFNGGTFTWTEYSDSSLSSILDSDSGTWVMTPGYERTTEGSPSQITGNVMSKWVESGWLGVFFEATNGWIYHPELGWMYAENSSGDKTWLYSDEKGWLWTSKDSYPHLYSDNSSNWVYIASDQDTPTKAFDYNPKKWTLWQDLTLMKMVEPSPDKLSASTSDEKKVYEIINSTASNKDKLNRIAEAIRSKL
jgi:hypothetical protein